MFKLIHIKDNGMMVDIKGRGLVRTPIDKILLDEDQIRRIISLHNGPKHVFIMNPKNNTELKRATLQNYKLPYSEIFKTVEYEKVESEVVPDTTQTYTLDDVSESESYSVVDENAITEVSESAEEVTEDANKAPETDQKNFENNQHRNYNRYNKNNKYNKKH